MTETEMTSPAAETGVDTMAVPTAAKTASDTMAKDSSEGLSGSLLSDAVPSGEMGDQENIPALPEGKQTARFLELLFRPGESVSYVLESYQAANGKWTPASKGRMDRTAGQIIEALRADPEHPEKALGSWRPEAGGWIHINPLDGSGVKDMNVTVFRNALVECDDLSLSEQERLLRSLRVPIRALTYSGGRSLHAVVRVDAKDAEEYRERVDQLYMLLAKNGLPVDVANRNPSRLTRLAGITRGGKLQGLIAENIGLGSWEEWLEYMDERQDALMIGVRLDSILNDPPQRPVALIGGVLRQGHKMLLSGSSKAGKSFLLMELCIAIAEGRSWLGFPCRQGRVLYINLEIDPASCLLRFQEIYRVMDLPIRHMENITVVNLRGHAVPLDQLVPRVIRRVRGKGFVAVVLDPIYKVIMGDENSASDMGAFCNQFDRICMETGCSMIYSHHHSKGAQGLKKAMDRASGSGVFARDPDALLDLIQLELSDEALGLAMTDTATAWRLEGTLREFPSFRPVDFWFEYPVHRVDTSGTLAALAADGGGGNNLAKGDKAVMMMERQKRIDSVFDSCRINGIVTVRDLAANLHIAERTLREWFRDMDGYYADKGVVVKRG